ncbi:MAG: hypothetical protein Q8J68_07410 [Methanolobus sp.]|jgi:hypothetical protein|uniref:hypothetical protein n=1 Tax=Methanolobus sp. TaxID=1874737 RepID=UPI0027305786|nr:hypothetical protein [Methanolobus sp.]MDP2217093.1 hypothetical protein [Methanolobus sp.]
MEIDPMPLIPEYYFTPVEAVIGITYIYRYLPNNMHKSNNCTSWFDFALFMHARGSCNNKRECRLA